MKQIISVAIAFTLLAACNSPEQQVIKLAGENGCELQKVLDHFKADSCKEKYEAARFLIRNMGGHYSLDTACLASYRPYISTACSLYTVHNHDNKLLKKAINTTWSAYKQNEAVGSVYSMYWLDYENIKADYLINDIELAYEAWNTNPYNTGAAFDEFCEYVLPYRRKNGLPVEKWRVHFNSRKKDHFNKHYPDPLIKACDSLLYGFRELKHNQFLLSDYPLMTVKDFEQLKRGFCDHRCWYNSMLFASLGIPCAIDFVPAWGNRNSGHSWNVIIKNGESYAFEPFWDTERWKYKRIYNNKTWDDVWGKFRLPKVYRHTYSSHPDGPISDSRIDPVNIPGLFRNMKKADVSDEYFATVDVELEITEKIPDDTYYCYLCVFGYQQWHPVQWGKIKGESVIFKGMGKGIVYLPCFYKNGQLVYAADPFLLSGNGAVKKLSAAEKIKKEITVRRVKNQDPCYGDGIKRLKESRIEVSNDSEFVCSDVIHVVPDTMLYSMNIQNLNSPIKKRYVRLVFSSDTAEVSELCFYRRNSSGGFDKLSGNVICHKDVALDEVENTFDNLIATSSNIKLSKIEHTVENNTLWIGLDFGRETRIDAIGYCPEIMSQLKKQVKFELFYWKNGWRSIDIKEGNGQYLKFSDVPANSLLMLKNKEWKVRSRERIFVYEDGEQKWY